MKDMNIGKDFQFAKEQEDIGKTELTLDEAFAADPVIHTIEQLAHITSKMSKRNVATQGAAGEKENAVIVAGQRFSRAAVEMWLVDQEFDNNDEDGQNSPDAELERDMQTFTVTRYISLGDLVSTLKSAGMTLQDLSGADLMDVLWELGLNTKEYKVKELTDNHRDYNDKAVWGLRFLSQERFDDVWLNSGRASFEAKVAAAGDESLERELASIGRQ
jgi:hypothetical protein